MSLGIQEIKLKCKKVLGVQQPFWQGGSLRLTIPKRALRVEMQPLGCPLRDFVGNGEEDRIRRGYFGLIFLDTDKGFLLVPFTGPINPITFREKLSFIDLSKISDDEIKLLLEEEE